MTRLLTAAIATAAVVLLTTADVDARGGRIGGGGGRVGGGGSFGRGSFGGRTPSMSARPSISRPSISQQPSFNRPSVSRPSFNQPLNRPSFGEGSSGINRPTTLPSNRPHIGGSNPGIGTLPSNRPSREQLQDFLNLPGQASQLPTRPDVGNRPDRPDISNRPDRPNIDNRPSHLPANIRNDWKDRTNRPFDKDWWNNHHGDDHWHWHANWNRYPAYWCWRPCTWGAVGRWLPYTWSDPYYYDYGTTIVYQDNGVYYGDKKVATEQQYYDQANTIAEAVPADLDPDKVEWMPLSVWAIAAEGVADTGMLLQLAVSKEGVIAGTYYNETTGSSRPVEGSVDEKTQRAAWKFVDDSPNQITFETGVFNLTKDETKCLVHFGPDKTQTWSMVRIPPPEEEKQE